MVACGLLAVTCAGWPTLAVAAAIALSVGLYTWLHKQSAWSALAMGLCRALLPLLGWAASPDSSMLPVVLLAGLALLCHVAGISLLARGESAPGTTRAAKLGYGCFFASTLVMGFCALSVLKIPPAPVLIGLLPYVLWISACLFRRINTAQRVAGLLAGIPLVDWMLLLPIHLGIQTGHPDGGFTSPCLWLPPLAFLAGKALQRYAPAT
jgi:4-hydroxybenzoate polyprenyltransferase